MSQWRKDFTLGSGTYLLNHSVGRPLRSVEKDFSDQFFAPWLSSEGEAWGGWVKTLEEFHVNLGKIFNSAADNFCSQVNNSAALGKIVGSLPRLQKHKSVVLMSEIDFPSMGYALRAALPDQAQIRFIPESESISDFTTWDKHLTADVDFVFISHAYSNTGQQAPLKPIVEKARSIKAITLIDVAQSAGVLPLDLAEINPHFLIGSCVKWLCGGPGSAFLWVHPEQVGECTPREVGWFSHENPFAFDIHHFAYHKSAMRFFGGTPSVAPLAIANSSLRYLSQVGVGQIRQHNQMLLDHAIASLEKHVVSPVDQRQRSGTLVLSFGEKQEAMIAHLKSKNIKFDVRKTGLRFSPHLYNSIGDIDELTQSVQSFK